MEPPPITEDRAAVPDPLQPYSFSGSRHRGKSLFFRTEASGVNTNPLVVDNAEGQLGTLARANAFEMP